VPPLDGARLTGPGATRWEAAVQDGSGKRWWDGRVGYEVYLPSFADGSGDGLGDLRGVRERLEHLERLGVDLLWLTPFLPVAPA